MPSKFQTEIIQRLTRLETMMSNHLTHHEKTEKKFYRLWLPLLLLAINLSVGLIIATAVI